MIAAEQLLRHLDDQPPDVVIGSVAVTLARRQGLEPDDLVDPRLAEVADDIVPDDAALSVDLLGLLHERSQTRADRRRRASHYTPADVAARLVDLVVAGRSRPPGRLCDPTVGGGAFLLAGARAAERHGASRRAIATEVLWGADLDPMAVAVSRTALALWAGHRLPDDRLVVADTLVDPPPWPTGFDCVIGNPPFLSPLSRTTAPDPDRRARLRDRFGDAFGPYVDAAALFLLVGLDLLAPGGRLGLVQPLSMLAARDATPVRRQMLDRAALRALWVASERIFGASVEVCAPVVEKGGRSPSVELHRGRDFIRVGQAPAPAPDELAPMAAPLVGIPTVDPPAGPLLGAACDVVAGFRDEYYAVAAATREGGVGPRVVTAGRIGPLRLDGEGRPVRIQRRDFIDPRVDLVALATENRRVAAWVDRLLAPKVLVATQTPVIEAVADPDGTLVPLTPVIAVLAPPTMVWAVAGLLSAPSISALAAARTLGLGRHTRVVKLAAREIRGLPGLSDGDRWPTVAELARRTQSARSASDWQAGLVATARAADEALDAGGDEVLAWWSQRLGIDNPGAGLRRGR